MPAGGSVDVPLVITSPEADEEEMSPNFGGYVHFSPAEEGGAVYSVAYGGSAFDLQDIEVLADMTTGLELPALAHVTACEVWDGIDCVAGGSYAIAGEDAEYTMGRGDRPVLLMRC